MNRKIMLIFLALFAFSCVTTYAQVIKRTETTRVKPMKFKLAQPFKFDIQGIKRIKTTPTKVVLQVQYYISPKYPKACYIGAYVPNKARMNRNFGFNPAGRKPNGVPKGQKHFTDNVVVEVHYRGKKSFTSKTIEMTIYDGQKTLHTKLINWGQTWGKMVIAPYRFKIDGIKRVITTPTKVKFQVQYYISPHYPKPCFIGAYVPNKARMSPHFPFKPAGRLPNGVPKGQKHFTDNVTFEVNYNGSGQYTSRSIEVVIYESGRNIKTSVINWGQVWGTAAPPAQADFIITNITVSKYNPNRKTVFTVYVKNKGGTATGQADMSVWFYKLLPNGSEPSTPNEYWEGKVGGFAPGQTKSWVHDHYNFLTEGNFRIRAKVNQHHTITESNYGNNTKVYNFTIPN